MVLKMLYNWDDMHIFGFALPKKTKTHLAVRSQRVILRLSITYEQQMLMHEAASLKPSFIIS